MGIFESIKYSSKRRINTPITGLLILSNPPPQNRDQIPKLKEDLTYPPSSPYPRALGHVQGGETGLGFP